MANLFIVPASTRPLGDELGRQLSSFIGSLKETSRAGAVLLHPDGMAFDRSLFTEVVAYEGRLGLESNAEIWRPLLRTFFGGIYIIGHTPLHDYNEIVLGCYLNGFRKLYASADGVRDLAQWQSQVRPNMAPRPVRIQRLDEAAQRDYVRAVHRWLGTELEAVDFDRPVRELERSPEFLIYRVPRLAADLAQLTVDLQQEAHGVSFSVLRYEDGSFVFSSDFYRSLANFVGAAEGISSVLDVGCGSGFLACHLAASGRYQDVMGIDASPERIAGARLHAELNASTARFETISVADIQLPDKSVDMAVTSFALEQTGEHLERCFAEICRVTRKLIVLYEPTNEFFPTLPSLWHVPKSGWANQYHPVLVRSGLSYAVRPPLLSHYFNPGTFIIVDLESAEHPRIRHPALFGTGADAWPGGVTFV